MNGKNLKQDILDAQQKPVEFLAFSGGGAKGAIYAGVYEALKSSGAMDGVRAVAGSSAGAITAALIATGITPKDFETISKNTNLKGLLGKKGFLINKDGGPLLELLQTTILKNIANFINENDVAQVSDQRLIKIAYEQNNISEQKASFEDQEKIVLKQMSNLWEELTNNPGNKTIEDRIEVLEAQKKDLGEQLKELSYKERETQEQAKIVQAIANNQSPEFDDLMHRCAHGGKIYFKDLKLLRAVDPDKFKDLVVTAVRKDNGELTIFNSKDTPDVEIALACRASASIPLVFKPVKIDGVKYVDGGYRDNIPTKYFESSTDDTEIEEVTDDPEKSKDAKNQGRTIAFAFSSNEMDAPVNIAIYSGKPNIYDPSAIIKFLVDVIFKAIARVGGHFKYTETEKDTYESLRRDPLNVVPLDTKDVSTLSFDTAQAKADYLQIKGYIQAMGHMRNHGLDKEIDKEFAHKEFLLTVYEKVESRNLIESWGDRIDKSRQIKAEHLLSFCRPEKWEVQQKSTILEDYIVLAATKRSSGVLSNDTNTISKLVESLNDPFTSIEIKKDFIKVTGIDIEKDQRFDKNKSFDSNITRFNFQKEDFDAVLAKNKDVAITKNNGLSRA